MAASNRVRRFWCAIIGSGRISTSPPRDAAKARTLISDRTDADRQRTFGGAPVCRIDAAAPPDVPGIRDRLHAAGIDTYEADVRFATRFLIDRDIKGGCEIDGEAIARVADRLDLRRSDV